MEFRLSGEQLRLQQLARTFAYQEIRPRARELDRESDPRATYPIDLIRRASQLGLRTLKIPVEYGGLGADCLTEVIVLEELCVGDVGFGMTLQHAWREGYILAAFTTEEQRSRYLSAFLEDDTYVTSFAITEEHAGSDNSFPYDGELDAGPRTTAVLDGNEWVINGRKRFITNGNVARMIVLWARTDRSVPWRKGISGFLVPGDTPGFRVGRVENKLGIRLNQNAELIFEDCRIPKDNLLGELNQGEHLRHLVGIGSKTKEGAKALGVARAALEAATNWARNRIQGGRPIAEHQAIATMLADMATEIELGRTLMWRAAWSVDHEPEKAGPLEDMVKVYTSDAALRVAVQALEVFGGYGVLTDNPVEKLVRDAASMLHAGAGNQAMRVRMGGRVAREPLPSALEPV